MCFSFLSAIFNPKKHVLDKHGMVGVIRWEKLYLSQSHSCANLCFNFEISKTEQGYTLKGACVTKNGSFKEDEKGTRLNRRTVEALGAMRLDDLPDDIKTEHNSDDDVFILDGTITSLKLIYSDGSIVDKAITDDLAMKIYELLSQEL